MCGLTHNETRYGGGVEGIILIKGRVKETATSTNQHRNNNTQKPTHEIRW